VGDIIARLRDEADIVLFDVPPVIAATDAAELAPQVDGVLLVVAAGRTKRDDARRALELLTRVGAPVIGATLVNAPAGNRLA
jgi:non-specific protein-tyrosine kinase